MEAKRRREEEERARFPSFSKLGYLASFYLVFWIFWKPSDLLKYRKLYGMQDEKDIGKWLVSYLVWIPFLLSIININLGWIPILEETSWKFWIYLSIFVLFPITALISNEYKIDDDNMLAFIILSPISFFIGIIFVIKIHFSFLIVIQLYIAMCVSTALKRDGAVV